MTPTLNDALTSATFESVNSRNGAAYVARLGRYVLRIEQNTNPENPWSAFWGGEPPLMVRSGGRHSETHTYGDFPNRAHSARAFTRATLKAFVRSQWYGDQERAEVWRDALHACGPDIADRARGLLDLAEQEDGDRECLNILTRAFDAIRWTCLNTSSYGYSQGDHADLLLVASPDWLKKTGQPIQGAPSQLAAAAKLYGYWAWGDVWGVVVETSDGEQVDSCWGYYTDSPDDCGDIRAAFADLIPDDWAIDPDIGDAAIYAAA